jgi:hypothetical protein
MKIIKKTKIPLAIICRMGYTTPMFLKVAHKKDTLRHRLTAQITAPEVIGYSKNRVKPPLKNSSSFYPYSLFGQRNTSFLGTIIRRGRPRAVRIPSRTVHSILKTIFITLGMAHRALGVTHRDPGVTRRSPGVAPVVTGKIEVFLGMILEEI